MPGTTSASRGTHVVRYATATGWFDRFDLLILLVACGLYLIVCPFTKVEESFNMQATHDLLFHPHNLTKFDHHEFPGVVPRTFLGPIILSSFAYPFQFIMKNYVFGSGGGIARNLPFPWNSSDAEKLATLYLVRFILGFLVVLAIAHFRRSIQTCFGRDTSKMFALITVAQFHLLFYSTRLLPNTFALIFVIFAFSYWLRNKITKTFALLTFAAVVFRSDVLVLIVPMGLYSVLSRNISLFKIVAVGIITVFLSLILTVTVDSYYWQRLLWPEGQVLYFNTVLNKSHEWGTSPYHWYFTNALPRALSVAGIALLPIGLLFSGVDSRRVFKYFFCIVSYVLLYSFLPHKELRFVFNAIPILNLVAAVGMARIFRSSQQQSVSKKQEDRNATTITTTTTTTAVAAGKKKPARPEAKTPATKIGDPEGRIELKLGISPPAEQDDYYQYYDYIEKLFEEMPGEGAASNPTTGDLPIESVPPKTSDNNNITVAKKRIIYRPLQRKSISTAATEAKKKKTSKKEATTSQPSKAFTSKMKRAKKLDIRSMPDFFARTDPSKNKVVKKPAVIDKEVLAVTREEVFAKLTNPKFFTGSQAEKFKKTLAKVAQA
eukprot:GEZU01014115.1.p1 GENE.GEZU01014115.1~~GEZU01014115.1.p1  ORF type:complete len:604 (-),score=139.97 GEZU01014115.1:371-2182(-)